MGTFDQLDRPSFRSSSFVCMYVKTPSSAGASVGSQSELASPDFGFEFLDYPDGFDVFERHSSFDANLFELRRQAPEQIAVSCARACVCARVCVRVCVCVCVRQDSLY